MAKRSMMTPKTLGLALMVLGVGLALWGYQLSGSLQSEITQVVTGAHTDKVMMLYIGGAASFIVGLYLFTKKGRR
jgi:hypothetical protein